MRTLKIILVGNIVVLIGALLFAQNFTEPNLPTADGQKARIEIEGGVSGKWLTIDRVNKSDVNGKGFDPSMTYLISEFKPIVKRLKSDKWLIQFECNVCEGLP